MDLRPEDNLLLSGIQIHPSASELEILNNLILQVQDWDYLIKTAIDRGIAPLLYQKLPRFSNRMIIPQPVQSKLQQAYYKTFSRSALLYEHFRRVAEAFTLHDIQVIALKGIYLSEWLYQDIGLRQMSDIDLLVKPEDAEACLAILSGLGFTPENDHESDFEKKLEVVHFTPMILSGITIEIHVKLHQDNERYCLPVADLWRNAIPVTINHTAVYSLNRNDLLMHLCIHLDKHFHQGHVQFTCFNDITNLLNEQDENFDWDALISTCRDYNCEKIVFKWLVFVHKHMNAPLPAAIISTYSELVTLKNEQLFYKYLHGYVGFTSGLHKHAGNFQYLDSFADRVRYFWEILFPSKRFMVMKFQIKREEIVWFYYPYRWGLGIRGLMKRTPGP